MIPARYAHLLFGFLLSGEMSLIVCGVATARARGLGPGLLEVWVQAWLPAWAIAFPVVLLAAPLTRRLVQRLTATR